MRRYYAPLVLLALLAIAAPAQADITASTITTPKGPHFALSHGTGTTVAVAGTAKGIGNVDIACVVGTSAQVLAHDVQVAGDGAFSALDVNLDPLTESAYADPGRTCRLLALPTGTTPEDLGRYRGPVLALSYFSPLPIDLGDSAGLPGNYRFVVAAADRSTEIWAFGACGLYTAVLDPSTLEKTGDGHVCSGSPVDNPELPLTGLRIDGQPAYTPGGIDNAPGGYGASGIPGTLPLALPSVEFDEQTGAAQVTERGQLTKCGPDVTYPPNQFSCAYLDSVPVQHERTTSVSAGDQVVRVVDHWSSTDGTAHRLDLILDHNACCDDHNYEYRFPGESGFSHHDAVAGALPAGAPILIRDQDAGSPGQLILPLQAADHVRILPRRDFGLEYRARTIPAHGELTFTHYYVTTRSAAELDGAAAKLLASLSKPAMPAPHGATPVTPAPLPQFARAGHLRVRRAGRTFRVTTRDRVTCPTACTVHVSGRRVVDTDLHVAAGERAAVRFRLTHAGARKLRRAGRLRLRFTLAAPRVSAQRSLRIRTGRS
jgi:hypothetical protein